MANKDTKIHQNILNEKKQLAMELKYQGLSYPVISKKINVSVNTIKSWFREGGELFEKYYDFADKKTTELEKDSRILLRREIWNAVAVINQALREKIAVKVKCPTCQKIIETEVNIPTSNRLKASSEVLDRVFGKAPINVEVTGEMGLRKKYDHLSDEQLDQRIKKLERMQAEQNVEESKI